MYEYSLGNNKMCLPRIEEKSEKGKEKGRTRIATYRGIDDDLCISKLFTQSTGF